RSPEIGGRYASRSRRLAGVRAITVPGLPKIVVFYLTHARAIEVVRVLHGARDIDAALRQT
ncbi:MAG: hypothetical protein KDA71_10290, partial [Planctomycetales bacterium]|nr:hypothetical protein [Planctomycetales bacterium]